MAGQPDPAFLNNVPSSITTTVSNSATTVSATLNSITSVLSAAASAATGTATSSDDDSIYFYTPSTAVAIVFSVLYGILIPYHFYLSIYSPYIRKFVSQKHRYTIPLLFGCIIATAGFALRVASTSPANRSSVTLYALSQTLVIVAPIFVCATLYLLIAHLINLCLPAGKDRIFLGITPRWLSRAFITSDVLSFLMQGSGSGIAASGDWEGSEKNVGTAILIAGLAAQLVTFTLYMVILALFCFRVKAGHETRDAAPQSFTLHTTDASDSTTTDKRDFGLNPLAKQVVKGVWIASVFIEIRSIFRTIEFGMGIEGYPFNHEWMLWVFDATPIWVALIALGYYHPVRWLQSKRRSYFMNRNAERAAQQEG